MKKIHLAWLLALFTFIPASFARANSASYLLTLTGDQAVPPGDPDGSASGILSVDDVTGEIVWNFTYANIADPTAMHIHGPNGPAGSTAGVFIGLGTSSSGPGILDASLTHASLSDLSLILSNPSDFYVNIHNADFPPGAVRDQLGVAVPEPSTALLLLTCLQGLHLVRRVR
ncbi:MAG: CHRD domain-containing protein [Pirellulaceae bacterium]